MRLVLYAVSTPHAAELGETARRLGWEIAAAVRNLPELPVPAELGDVVEVGEIGDELLALPFAVPQTNPVQRRDATADAHRRGFSSAATMIDPTAVVASSAAFGAGAYVGAGSVIGSGFVSGRGCLVNRSCSLGHHTRIGDYVATGPGVIVAGNCQIDDEAFLGAGCVIAPELRIGAGAVLGAGAVVVGDVAEGQVVVGNPARVLRAAKS
jgi:sugar O-acyltransferase (sialic acid O-acetyltransferase NeuD family)